MLNPAATAVLNTASLRGDISSNLEPTLVTICIAVDKATETYGLLLEIRPREPYPHMCSMFTETSHGPGSD